MKKRKNIIVIGITIIVVILIAVRLVANKQALDAEQKSVSEFTTVIPVVIDTVVHKNISNNFNVNGSFEALSEVNVVSEITGKVMQILAETGSYVKEGQKLAVTDNDLLQAKMESEKANYEKAQKDLERYELLAQQDAASTTQYENAKVTLLNAKSSYVDAAKQYENSIIKAPFSGIITKRYIEEGTYLKDGDKAFDIVEVSHVKFIAELTGEQVAEVKPQEEVTISVDALSGKEFKGKVNSISINADESKRYEVEIIVPNSSNGESIKPGMYGTVYFADKSNKEPLVIKRKALIGSIKKPQVFVLSGDTVVEKDIVIEQLNDDYLRIISGLNEGEKIIVSGQINLAEGSKVKVVKN